VRRSDKARFLEVAASQVLAVGLFFPLFFLPWWASTLLILGTIAALVALPDAMFPPVVAEPFGSAADTKRAAFRFWLVAPFAMVALVAIVVVMWR
jgi:hypothetical protein